MQVLASKIDFWSLVNNEGEDVMHLLHEFKMYPPRVTFEVDCSTAHNKVFELEFKFAGFSELDRKIMFPLRAATSAQQQVTLVQADPGKLTYTCSSINH